MRILHSMLHVADLKAVLEFYTRALDVHLLRRRDYPGGRFTLAFIGCRDECMAAAPELTRNWDRDGYARGNGYGRLAIEAGDAVITCARARTLGYRVTREAGPMQYGHSMIVFLENPDGYKVGLIQKGTQFD